MELTQAQKDQRSHATTEQKKNILLGFFAGCKKKVGPDPRIQQRQDTIGASQDEDLLDTRFVRMQHAYTQGVAQCS